MTVGDVNSQERGTFAKTYPEGDNRPTHYFSQIKDKNGRP